jgi:hypothetical protein
MVQESKDEELSGPMNTGRILLHVTMKNHANPAEAHREEECKEAVLRFVNSVVSLCEELGQVIGKVP